MKCSLSYKKVFIEYMQYRYVIKPSAFHGILLSFLVLTYLHKKIISYITVYKTISSVSKEYSVDLHMPMLASLWQYDPGECDDTY
jgi:hypothetical protein